MAIGFEIKNFKPKKYLTTAECAEMIGRSVHGVRGLVKRRMIPFRKPGGRLTFIRPEIETWIENAPGIRLEHMIEHKNMKNALKILNKTLKGKK